MDRGTHRSSLQHGHAVNLRDLNYFRLQRGWVIVPDGLSNIPPLPPTLSLPMCARGILFIIFRTYEIGTRGAAGHVDSIMK